MLCGLCQCEEAYYVARIQLQKQPGHWPAFWIMGDGVGKVGDEGRDGTEIDIMENPWLDAPGMTRHTRRQIWRWPVLRDCLMAGWTSLWMPGRSHRGTPPPADEQLVLLAAELRRHVVHLAEEIGERNVQRRPAQLAQAADYIEADLVGAGHLVKRQAYEVNGCPCYNLEVEILGTKLPDEIVVIGAHYDSVPGSPAANDNASGVAAMLSLAHAFSKRTTDRTLRFLAFVNEELPYAHTEQMGSWVYARRCRERDEKVTAMLSLETIGYFSEAPGSQKYPPTVGLIYPSVGNFIGFIGNNRYRRLVRQVVAAFRSSEPFPSQGGALPEIVSHIGRSDHWSFWQEGYPALMVTDTAPFRYPHYHTPEDTADKIDFEKLARVVRGLQAVVCALVSHV